MLTQGDKLDACGPSVLANFVARVWEVPDDVHANIKFFAKSSASKIASNSHTILGNKANGESGARWAFIENENGNRITKAQLAPITDTSRSIFEQLAQLLDDKLAPTWSKVANHHLQHFYSIVEARHLELHLCEDHWKARELGKHVYASWMAICSKRTNIKTEPAEPVLSE